MVGVDLLSAASASSEASEHLRILGPFNGMSAHEWNSKLQDCIATCRQLDAASRAAHRNSQRVSASGVRLSLSRLRAWSRAPPARPPQSVEQSLAQEPMHGGAKAGDNAQPRGGKSLGDRSRLLADSGGASASVSSSGSPNGYNHQDAEPLQGSAASCWLCFWWCRPAGAPKGAHEPRIKTPLLKQADAVGVVAGNDQASLA